MAIPGITYRLEKGTSLTHTEMDDNFRSVIYSSSIHDGGDTLYLHFDTNANDYFVVPLNGGTGGLTINNNTDNRVVTATGTAGLVQGEDNLTFDGDVLTIDGRVSQDDGDNNVFIGSEAGDSISGAGENVALGIAAGKYLEGNNNTAVGNHALGNGVTTEGNVAIGYSALQTINTGDCNVTIGAGAGENLTSGAGNVHLGYRAGPGSSTAESNKLYINNQASDTPLILGDFSTGQINFSGGVTGSSFTGSFSGDGSGLTGLTVTQEWDGTRDGNAEITGSLVVSGSSVVVDFTNVETISGSIFSGSFVGDGSGLTGITATSEWDGTRDGNAEITGSFIVSGSNPTIDLKGVTIIDDNIKIHNFNSSTIGVGFNTLQFANAGISNGVAIGNNAACQATGCNIVAVGRLAGVCTGNFSTLVGSLAARNNTGCYNTSIGYNTIGGTGNGKYNTAVGSLSQNQITSGQHNTGVGHFTLRGVQTGQHNTGVGSNALYALDGSNHKNTAIGSFAGFNAKGSDNVLIGYNAGPATFTTTINNKLYIHNLASDTPLIYGDFQTRQLTIHNEVSASIFSGSFHGDGSNLTGLEWDGTHNGNAEITGSFTVSGSATIVDFSNTLEISGSIFSGSFTGDGSGLTGIETEWDGTRDGNAEITGSLIVSGAIDAVGSVTIGSQGYPGGPGVELIHYHSSDLSGINNLYTFPIQSSTGYTGIKVDYSLSNTNESEKKIGTLLGSWDQVGNSIINDSYTIAEGAITNTSFSIDASSTTEAILKLDASAGTYDVNMIITAFKRQV
jgi:hypothetical protein